MVPLTGRDQNALDASLSPRAAYCPAGQTPWSPSLIVLLDFFKFLTFCSKLWGQFSLHMCVFSPEFCGDRSTFEDEQVLWTDHPGQGTKTNHTFCSLV